MISLSDAYSISLCIKRLESGLQTAFEVLSTPHTLFLAHKRSPYIDRIKILESNLTGTRKGLDLGVNRLRQD
jgi:hypothetical protein